MMSRKGRKVFTQRFAKKSLEKALTFLSEPLRENKSCVKKKEMFAFGDFSSVARML